MGSFMSSNSSSTTGTTTSTTTSSTTGPTTSPTTSTTTGPTTRPTTSTTTGPTTSPTTSTTTGPTTSPTTSTTTGPTTRPTTSTTTGPTTSPTTSTTTGPTTSPTTSTTTGPTTSTTTGPTTSTTTGPATSPTTSTTTGPTTSTTTGPTTSPTTSTTTGPTTSPTTSTTTGPTTSPTTSTTTGPTTSPTTSTATSPLQVVSSDLQLEANAKAHHTSDYMSKDLIVRRCQPFVMKLTMNRAVTPKDNLQWWATTGLSPDQQHKIIVPISATSVASPSTWSAVSAPLSDTSMTVTISSPANAPIGSYSMGVTVMSGDKEVSQPFGKFKLLFNAWSKDDAVYMENEAERKEYVLNETGRIYIGSGRENPSFKVWDFGQFEERILDICLGIMDKSIEHRRNATKDIARRGDLVYLTRILSAMINSQDDRGVLMGNWSGNYEGGQRPTYWNGSVEILRLWDESGPVRYGQCWVYGGVLCTVLRCLGIPARVITNFSSAHDTDETLTIDRVFDKDGKEIFDSADSVWNYHVWNEAWFTREDLKNITFNGWQILDATPQEESGGVYCLGPCSLNAVKLGEVDLDYDTPFVYCEVNGDQIDWLYDGEEMRRLRVNTKSIGRFTSTKAVGSDNRHDVTNDYKYPEGSTTEREINKKAVEKMKEVTLRRSVRGSGPVAFSARNTEPIPKPDFECGFKQSSEAEVGQDVAFILGMKNISDKKASLNVKMVANAIVYTNAPVTEIMSMEEPVVFEPKEEKSIQMTIPYSQYEHALTTDQMIKAVAVCEDEKGGKLLVESMMTLKTPPIVVKATAKGQVNKSLGVEITFTNPLSEPIENSVLTIDGSGMVKEQITIEVPFLQKHEKTVTKLDITPYRPGQRCLLVNLSSDKLNDVKGVLQVKISPE